MYAIRSYYAQPTPYPLAIDLDTAWQDHYPLLVALIIAAATAGMLWSIRRWISARAENAITPAQVRPVLLWVGVTVISYNFV